MELFYRELGAGEPLLVLHGLFGSSDNWLSQAQSLSGNYRVIIPDLRDHGNSPHSESLRYPLMAGDVLDLIDRLGLVKPHLLGHSMGGKVVLQCAALNAGALGKLIVADISPRRYPVMHRQILDALLSLKLDSFRQRREAEAALAQSLTVAAVRMFLLKNLARDEEGNFRWKLNLPLIDRDIEHIGDEISLPDKIQNPILLIHGGRSPYVMADDIARYRSVFPSLQVKTLPGSGHWVHADEPAAFLTAVENFLEA